MTQTIAATREGQGIARGAVGTFTGDGTIVNVILGFKPKYVKLINLTDATVWEKVDGMGATQTMKTVTAGTLTTDTSTAITLNANTPASATAAATTGGFSVSAAAGINAKSFAFYAA